MEACVFFVGNPGAGKSTLCNSLGANFASGISIGYGLTQELQICNVTVNGQRCCVVDAPGLYDVNDDITRHNADEIKTGLCQNAEYKIVFVVTLESGRFIAQDLSMIKAVTKAIKFKKDQVAILINKVGSDVMRLLEDPGKRALLESILVKERIASSTIAFIGELDTHSNEGKQSMRNRLYELLHTLVQRKITVVDDISLTSEEVAKMQTSMKDLESKIKDQEEQNSKLRDMYNEEKTRIDEMLEQNKIKQDEHDRMMRRLEDRRSKEIEQLQKQNRILLGVVTIGGSEIYRWLTSKQ